VVSAVVISLMLLLSVALNFTQTFRSQQAAERLRRQVGQTATVVRDGTEREVPLLELLDPNFGLGPPAAFHGVAPGGDPRKAALRQQALYHLAITALRHQDLVVELDEEKLAQLESWKPAALTAPQSLDLSVLVVAEAVTDLDAGRFQIVVGPNLGDSGRAELGPVRRFSWRAGNVRVGGGGQCGVGAASGLLVD